MHCFWICSVRAFGCFPICTFISKNIHCCICLVPFHTTLFALVWISSWVGKMNRNAATQITREHSYDSLARIASSSRWIWLRVGLILTTNKALQILFKSVPRPPLQQGLGRLLWSAFGAHPGCECCIQAFPNEPHPGGQTLMQFNWTKWGRCGTHFRGAHECSMYPCASDEDTPPSRSKSNVTTPESNFAHLAQPILAMTACKHCLTVSSSNMRALCGATTKQYQCSLKQKVYAQRHW